MDNFEGTATLEWWANRSTCLARLGVRVTARATGNNWTCDAVLEPPLTAEERENFDFLTALDPLFTLRFGEDGMLHVHVAAAEGDGRLTLAAYQAEAAERAGTRQLP
ncbi:hypothetical protein [Streptomyces sp. NPDC021020]|uniref:hypothetical protein n=1 Tax=Streptomyces sp. NPDC021020 TaxID=3365109 RepID=UPI0037A90FC3